MDNLQTIHSFQTQMRDTHKYGIGFWILGLFFSFAMCMALPKQVSAQTVIPSLDVDGNGKADAFTDGMLIARFLMGFTGENLTRGVVDPNGERSTPESITTFLESLKEPLMDVDCNGQQDALTDGMMILRFLFGFKGPALIDGLVDPKGCRNTPETILPFLTNFLPGNDPVPPHLEIISPTANAFISIKRPNIEVSFSDVGSGVNTDTLSFIANETPLASTCVIEGASALCQLQTDLPEGSVTIEALLEDQSGNQATTEVSILIDSLPLEIFLTSPNDGLITKSEEIEVTGKISPSVTKVTVNGIEATLGNSFSAMVPLREGKNMIVAIAESATGKTGTDSVDITRDIVAPIVQITSPRNGFISVEDHIAVTGQVNDIVNGATNARVLVNGVPAPVANGAFMLTNLAIVRGPNTIEAIATDAVGNEGRHSITVNFQPPVGARIGIAAGNGQTGTVNQKLPNPLTAKVTDELGNPIAGRVVNFEVTRNNGTLMTLDGSRTQRVLQVPTNGSGEASVFYTLGDTTGEGNNRVKVTAQGVTGETEFCATAQGMPPEKILMVMGDNQRGLVDQPLPIPFEALVVDSEGNPMNNVEVTFNVVRGNGNINGNQSFVRTTGTDGIVRAVLTLGPDPGINNNLVQASFDGLIGLPASFVASGLLAGKPEDTQFQGVVIDNAQTPIPGAEVTIPEANLSTITDDEGQFLLENVPVGKIHLRIDPTNSPRPETFPPLAFETVTTAGQINILGQPIQIPALQTEGSKTVGGDQDVTLTMPGVEGLTLTVFANSATFPDGSKTGQLTISQVHLDKVPMPPPSGTIFMPPAWTIQPAGVVFDPPAKITIPNDGLPPGRVIDIFTFDHTLNEFINVGKGTVSDDGFIITSDPGFGITRSGWGGCGQPQPPTTDVAGNPGDPGAAAPGEPGSQPSPDNGNDETQVSPGTDGSSGGPDSAGPNVDQGADPVILATGEFIMTETDLSIPGRGFPFEFKRTYRSQFNFNGPLGHNWDFNYREFLIVPDPTDPNQDILRCSGRSRMDKYVRNPDGTFTSPDGFYDILTENPDGTFTIRNRNGFKTNFSADGKLASLIDRNGNTMSFTYDTQGVLTTVTDTMGRDIDFTFNDKGRLVAITDFFGRTIRYTYDGNGDLVAVRSPEVTGTVNGNDFPNGKTTRYEYSSGFDATVDPRFDFLNHNLVAITDPKGQRYLVTSYGEDPDSYEFDRVVRQQEGTPDQVHILSYTELNPGGGTGPNVPRNQTVAIDRNGNRVVSIHNTLGNLLEERVETNRNINPLDPPTFVTTHTYNADGERTSTTFPEGNRIEYTFDENNPDRFQQGNLIRITRLPGPRGGDQTQITTTRQFEPIYNQLRSITEPRGNDPTFIPQNGGAASAERYTTTMIFDYQEGNSLAALAAEMRMSESEVATLLANAGVLLNLGDQNGDGIVDRINGNLVRRQNPTVNLLPGSQQAGIEGDTTQEIVTTFTYNRFGQLTSETDPEGNINDFEYYPENDPDGDGTPSAVSASGRQPANDTGGYRKAVLFDNRAGPGRREATPPTQIRNEWLYDPVGNVIQTIDGRGNPTRYDVNQLNQVVRKTLEPPFNYEHLFFYDANNNVIREEIQNKDTNGPNLDSFVTITYDYDILDNRIQKTEEVSTNEILITRYTYDNNENPTQLIQPEGNILNRVYDERDLVFTVTRGFGSPDASTRTFTYDGNQNRIRILDAADNNGDGQHEELLDFFDGFDRKVRMVDAVGNVMTYAYDPASNKVREQHFGLNGGPSPTNNSGAGNVLLSEMTMKFDELNREFEHNQRLFANTTTVGPEGPLTPGDGLVTMRTEYDRNSRRTRMLDDNIHQRVFEYDGIDRVVREIDELNNEMVTTYDDNHNPVQTVEIERSPEGIVPDEIFTTTRQFDTIDRLTVEIDNLGNVMTYAYDSRNNITNMVDALGNTSTYVWDGINRKLSEQVDLRVGGIGSGAIDTSNPANPDGRLTRLKDWDGNSRLVSETDDNGNVTRYVYDELNRKTQDIFADTTTNQYVYDRDHNVIRFTDENGTVQTNTFDGINRAIAKDVTRANGVGGTTQWRFEYDGLSRMTKATDNNNPDNPNDDSTIEREYDSLSRMLVETQNGKIVKTTFDGVGNRLALTYPNNRVVEMAYDELDRLGRLQDQDTTPIMIAEYDYLGPNRVLERRYRNGVRLRYHDGQNQDIGYDGIKRRTAHQHVTATGDLIAGFTYAYDKENNRRFEADIFAGVADVYEYDSAYRVTRTGVQVPNADLTGITNNDTVNADVVNLNGASQNTYQLDGVGNWVEQQKAGTNTVFTANEMNEYVTVGGVAQPHDDNGNLLSDGSKTYVYDFANRLIQVTNPLNATTSNYTYDALGRRIRKDVNGSITTFFYDGARSIEERNNADQMERQYVYGRWIDELLELTTGGQSFFYHDNSIGSIVALTNGLGQVQERYRYEAYGEITILASDGATILPASTVSNPFGFTGRRLDAESGLYYYRARFYDPGQGRFLQRDPKGYVDGMGLYEYVTSNPVNFVDPFGMDTKESQPFNENDPRKEWEELSWEEKEKRLRQMTPEEREALRKMMNIQPPTIAEAEAKGYDCNQGIKGSYHLVNNPQNRKCVHPKGYEAVYDENGELNDDPEDRGTYNFCLDADCHTTWDVEPWRKYGTGTDDPSTEWERTIRLVSQPTKYVGRKAVKTAKDVGTKTAKKVKDVGTKTAKKVKGGVRKGINKLKGALKM